jgi:AcrR family transcriptional regulator
MSRPRVIDQDKILDAAEAVVARDGAARLTLDAVATEAGISKASVIYDYKSKQALIKAVIERRVAKEHERLRQAIENLGDVPNARIRGRLAVASNTMSDDTRAVAINLCSALAQDAELQGSMHEAYRKEVAVILETSTDPSSALLAFLALEGLRTLEFLGLLAWTEPERTQILRGIEALVAAPDKSHAPAQATSIN